MPKCIPEEEADRCLILIRRMLCWLPEERGMANELKNDPWLEDDFDNEKEHDILS
jgi:hypothetical protein